MYIDLLISNCRVWCSTPMFYVLFQRKKNELRSYVVRWTVVTTHSVSGCRQVESSPIIPSESVKQKGVVEWSSEWSRSLLERGIEWRQFSGVALGRGSVAPALVGWFLSTLVSSVVFKMYADYSKTPRSLFTREAWKTMNSDSILLGEFSTRGNSPPPPAGWTIDTGILGCYCLLERENFRGYASSWNSGALASTYQNLPWHQSCRLLEVHFFYTRRCDPCLIFLSQHKQTISISIRLKSNLKCNSNASFFPLWLMQLVTVHQSISSGKNPCRAS